MFSVSVIHDRDAGRAEQWLRGEGAAPVRTIGGPDPEGLRHLDRLQREATERVQGGFARLRFDVDQEHARALKTLDVPALTRRLEAALSRTLREQLPGARGAFSVRFEGPGADPRAYAVLYPNAQDGTPQRMLLRGDISALEASWERHLQREFGLRRSLDRAPETTRPEVRELEFQWQRSVSQVRDVLAARMRGEIPQERLRAAIERAQDLQDKLHAARIAVTWKPLAPDSLECIRFNVERGGEYLAGLPQKDVDHALLRSVQSASGLDARAAQDLGVIAYRHGADMRLSVFVADGTGWRQNTVDLDALRTRLADHLGPELEIAARQYDSHGRGTAGTLGRAQLLGPEPARPGPSRLSVAVERAAGGASFPAPISVEYRLSRGARDLGAFSPERRAEILEHAVNRTLPFLKERGIPSDIRTHWEGRALRVHVMIPGDAGWTRAQLEGRPFEARLVHEVHRKVALSNGTALPTDGATRELGQGLQPVPAIVPGRGLGLTETDRAFLRDAGVRIVNGDADRSPKAFAEWLRNGLRAYRSPVPFREALQGSIREAARGLAQPMRLAWERLSRVVPAPMRAAFVLARTVGRVIPRE